MPSHRRPRRGLRFPTVAAFAVATAVGIAPAAAQAAPTVVAAPAAPTRPVRLPARPEEVVAPHPRTAAALSAARSHVRPVARPAARPGRPYCTRVVTQWFANRPQAVAGFCGRRMSDVEMVAVLRRAGWTWRSVPTALATFIAESDGYTDAVHHNRAGDGHITSSDVSWVQINDHYHPGIRSVDHRDPVVAARFARRLARRYGLGIWNGYQYRGRFTDRAAVAVRTARAHGVR